MIITITLNAALDRTQRIEHPLVVGKLNRATSSHLEPGGKGINVSRAIKALGGNSVALGFCAGTNGRIMKDMLTAADIHHDFVDVAGQMRVNTQIIDAQGGSPGTSLFWPVPRRLSSRLRITSSCAGRSKSMTAS